MTTTRPNLSFAQIWNMCFGFLGIQFAFALQNANVSRIFQSLGASVDEIPLLWVAAPLTGLLVQPLVGHFSDKTWGRFGRRKPYFTIGALLTTLALLWMPNSPYLWAAAVGLWVLDASINIAMEPFRAYVGDNLPQSQRATGYLMQSFFIGVGAVVASLLPWLLTEVFGVSNSSEPGTLPNSVLYAFYIGAAVLFCSMMWTVISSKEYSPAEIQSFEPPADSVETLWTASAIAIVVSLCIGAALTGVIWYFGWDKQLFVISGGVLVYGFLLCLCLQTPKQGGAPNFMHQILSDAHLMPDTMKRLAPVQFFSWMALFAMWIYTTAAVTSYHYQTSDTHSELYNQGANWVGVLFSVYNGVAALAAIGIAYLSKRLSRKLAHAICLGFGAAGLMSFYVIPNPQWLWLAMVGVGIAWASILSMPYAILSVAVPGHRMGTYMGLFNFFIVIPQLVAASTLGLVLKFLFDGQAIFALVFGGVCFLIAAALCIRIKDEG